MPDLFEVEWQRVQPDDNLQKRILGVLAHDRRTHTLDDLAGLLGTDVDAVSARIRDLTFLSVDTKRNVAFASDSFRRFAAQQLKALRNIVWDLLIARLAQEPESEEALEHLPVFYERASKLEELLDYLSPTNLSLIVQSCQSLVPVQQKAKMGLDAAHKLHRDGDLVRFSIQQATVHELDGAQVWRSEVEALTALGDYPAAMALAQTTVLREDRLHLLAVIARAQRERGEWPEPELAESIALLCNETDLPALGDKAVDIAEDLLSLA
jgi:hypothetical protein